MKARVWAVLAASLILSGPAFAIGLNPSDPGLPGVSDSAAFGASAGSMILKNGGSAMCIDCHTLIPKAGGTHYVASATGATATYSGGSGISSTGGVATREGGEYFNLKPWPNAKIGTNNAYSKYADTSTGVVSKMISNLTNRTATQESSTAGYPAYQLICESCHNVIANVAGGNNLLESESSNNWTNTADAKLCTSCHGFMYTMNSSNTGVNYTNAKNHFPADSNTTAWRGNNEWHWIKGNPYRQNHHIMTDDVVNNTVAGQGLLWTDNLIVSYTRTAMDLVTQSGSSYRAPKSGWDVPAPTANDQLSCTNCHMPAHGADVTEGASILRTHGSVSLDGPATTAIQRQAERNSGNGAWKRFSDLAYCGQCHK